MATIIAFANQKGGVGKTTLCTTLANFLAEKGDDLLVIDCDSQQSIAEKRKNDKGKYKSHKFNYEVKSFDLRNPNEVMLLMNKLKELDGTILIDTPGHLSMQGLVYIFANADFIICPYQYEATCISSTSMFLKFFQELKGRVENMTTRLLLVANRYDKRIGKKEELELWELTERTFSNYGEILPRIETKADMLRYNTVSLFDGQVEIVRDCYNRIMDLIKKHNEEARNK